MKAVDGSYFEASRNRLVRRLGEPLYEHGRGGGRRGRVKLLNDLAGAGLPVPEGVVLTEEVHRVFLKESGVLEGIKVAAWRGEEPRQKASEIRSHYGSAPVEAALNQGICQALIGLGAPEVAVLAEHYEQRALKTIPDVVGAVREAWLSADGLEWQIEKAAAREEVPTWPVLIQRKISPLYTGWSSVEETPIETPGVDDRLGEMKVALYDVEPFGAESPERNGITLLTLEAASVLGASRGIFWGLEGGMWYVLSAEMEGDEGPVQGRFS
ncbi:MAG TPA: hypothetical protein VFY59_01795 [Rubrobacter sp.]|nr:hypothetical protein [Rubrobacter sp.]